jgi:hypothetical protein
VSLSFLAVVRGRFKERSDQTEAWRHENLDQENFDGCLAGCLHFRATTDTGVKKNANTWAIHRLEKGWNRVKDD